MEKQGIAYIHADKQEMGDLGLELGITGDALRMFLHAFSEVKIEFFVDTDTGLITSIIAVDDTPLEVSQ